MLSIERINLIATVPYKLAGAVTVGAAIVDRYDPTTQADQLLFPAAAATAVLWLGRAAWGGVLNIARADQAGAVSGHPERMR